MALLASSSYPLLDAFWTVLWIVGFVLWIWLAIAVFTDIFRSHDLSGGAKALWVVAIFVMPLLGVLLYFAFRGSKMRQHAEADISAQERANREYIRSVAATSAPSPASEIQRLVDLRDSGALSQDEFEAQKARVLSGSSAGSAPR